MDAYFVYSFVVGRGPFCCHSTQSCINAARQADEESRHFEQETGRAEASIDISH